MNTITTNGTRNVPVPTKSGREAIIANNPAIQALIAEAELANAAAVTEYNGVTYNQAEIRAWMRSAISRGNKQRNAVAKETAPLEALIKAELAKGAKADVQVMVTANTAISNIEEQWVNINETTKCLLSLEDGEKWGHFYGFFESIGHNLSRGVEGLWCDAKDEVVEE